MTKTGGTLRAGGVSDAVSIFRLFEASTEGLILAPLVPLRGVTDPNISSVGEARDSPHAEQK